MRGHRWKYPLCQLGQKWPTLGVTCFTLAYIGRNIKKYSCLKPQGLEPWYLLWAPNEPLPILFKLCPAVKNGLARPSHVYTGLYRKNMKNLLVWNPRPRAKNDHLSQVSPGKWRAFNYTNASGRGRNAWCLTSTTVRTVRKKKNLYMMFIYSI